MTLSELIERVEKAEEGSDHLSANICDFLVISFRPVTTSNSFALRIMIEDQFPGWAIEIQKSLHNWWDVCLSKGYERTPMVHSSPKETLALALCLAALRAKEQSDDR